jgi:superfamily II RNA helicase
MVIITDNNNYDTNENYSSYFELFSYNRTEGSPAQETKVSLEKNILCKEGAGGNLGSLELSPFQKHAIQGIVDGNHVLITAATGSGKTLPAEFAIQHFVNQCKRVIYCSPIKALSNQKTFDFRNKYPNISFGLLTGDIKSNPCAQVLVMTTEILLNKLYNQTNTSSLSFDMDIESELGCVIFDELHYINDEHRGHVWEQSIMMLPKHVQMVMLSATLDDPVKFASWIEGSRSNSKSVVLCSTDKRIVPLSHYMFMCSTEGLFKKLKCKETEQRVKQSFNKCLPIQSADGKFNESVYKESRDILNIMNDNAVYMKRKHVLNELATHMYNNDMLPAIAFVFSRKLVEQCAQDIDVRVLEDDSKVTYNVRKECEAIIRKLPNWREYEALPEYQELVRLLEKGIGIHHSGMIPVLREIVELMISKKYIKLLFATESFAIGLDCPIRTAVFLGLQKYTDGGQRYLYAHEYTQMAGRAGRRGIDTVGHVIHCNNLFELPPLNVYKEVLCGKPQKLVSKFQLYYPVVFNECNIKNSMYQEEIAKMRKGLEQELVNNEEAIAKKDAGFEYLSTPRDQLACYFDLMHKAQMATNKKRKEIDGHIRKLKDTWKYLDKDIVYYREYIKLLAKRDDISVNIENNDAFVEATVNNLKSVMTEFGLINDNMFTERGQIVSNIAEINPVLFSLIYERIVDYSPVELATFFSMFVDVRVSEDDRVHSSEIDFVKMLESAATTLQNAENLRGIHMKDNGLNNFCYDLLEIMPLWCECSDENQCKQLLSQIPISIGDFTKAILKISTICREVMSAIDITCLKHSLSQVDGLILKYVATNQSLYL